MMKRIDTTQKSKTYYLIAKDSALNLGRILYKPAKCFFIEPNDNNLRCISKHIAENTKPIVESPLSRRYVFHVKWVIRMNKQQNAWYC